ncbi:MAG: DinB family protein [Holophaga sp.]|nr:DinB family protein [Holophaga sp.]
MKPTVRRPGALGALMDELDRAVRDLVQLVGPLTQVNYDVVRDRETADEDCRSIHTVVEHVVRSGYGYTERIRGALDVPFVLPDYVVATPLDALHELQTMAFTLAGTFEGRWDLESDVRITARSGRIYDLEQLIEHAIVHVLRHRRQIERFLTETRFKGDRR